MNPLILVFATIAALPGTSEADFPPYLIWTVPNHVRDRLYKGTETLARDDLAQLAFNTPLESARELPANLAADVYSLECAVISQAELASIAREPVENGQVVLDGDNAFGLWLRGQVSETETPFESVRVSVHALLRMRA